jgi:hypothetical protein
MVKVHNFIKIPITARLYSLEEKPQDMVPIMAHYDHDWVFITNANDG